MVLKFTLAVFSLSNVMLPALKSTTLEYNPHASAFVSPKTIAAPRTLTARRQCPFDCAEDWTKAPWRRTEPLTFSECSAAIDRQPRQTEAT
jgi:hypothetical protein